VIEIEPYEGITPAYFKVRDVISDLISRLNDSGHMKGTFLESIPRSEDSYTLNVLKTYHSCNLATLKAIIGECKGVIIEETSPIGESSSLGSLSHLFLKQQVSDLVSNDLFHNDIMSNDLDFK